MTFLTVNRRYTERSLKRLELRSSKQQMRHFKCDKPVSDSVAGSLPITSCISDSSQRALTRTHTSRRQICKGRRAHSLRVPQLGNSSALSAGFAIVVGYRFL